MQTTIRSTFDKVRFDQEKDIHAVFTLTAPKIDWQAKRAPIAVVPIIDISGSMQGQKLDYARKSVMKLIDHLQPGDYCGLVVFSTTSQVVAPVMEMTQAKKDDLKAKVGALGPQDSTNFAGGMIDGLGLLTNLDLPKNVVQRAIIFTDGLANVGVATKRADLMKLLEQTLGPKSSFSCFGYGQDCDQELLRDLAAKGRGNYAFVKNPEDALTAFARELGGLLSTYARNIEIHVAPQGAHKIAKVVSDVDVTEDNGKVTVKLPDILSEEVRHIVLAVHLAAQNQPLPRPLNVLEVTGSYERLDGGTMRKETFEAKLKIEFVKEGEEQATANADVDAIVGLAQVAEAQVEAEAQAAQGNYAAATATMDWMERHCESRGLVASANVAKKLKGMMTNSSLYASSAGYRSSSKSGVLRSMGFAGDAEAEDDLKAAGAVYLNDAVASTQSSFGGADAAPGPVTTTGTAAPVGTTAGLVVPSAVTPTPKPAAPKGLGKSKSKRW